MSFEHIFNEMEVEAEPFALCELLGRCDMGMERRSGATLHYVLAGRGEIVFENDRRIPVSHGTLVLVPALHAHTLRNYGVSSDPVPECHPAELHLAAHLRVGDTGEPHKKLLAICSNVRIGLRGVNDLIDLIREPIVEQVEPDSSVVGPVEQLLKELSVPTLGRKAMVRVLLLQCMIHLLRQRLLDNDPALNWMGALVDERLWSALRQMLEAPGGAHSVESLAKVAGMSRSAFADQFSTVYGRGPMKLLRDIRMNHAGSLLEHSDLPVKRVAELTGFSSRSAFNRSFWIATGKSPRDFRANTRGK